MSLFGSCVCDLVSHSFYYLDVTLLNHHILSVQKVTTGFKNLFVETYCVCVCDSVSHSFYYQDVTLLNLTIIFCQYKE